ncbi:hypothetical protein BI364_12075 [Acidihalobacter yilgarnensis]|uniref:DUF4124 domain-containing protein n=1 Tax=Acidihalobacter yilgarnensis TaxID=2819280 RepID=A0A1D8IQ73_9GAMM|nr:hypothetical protein BI364_12075 [Acidihalobacter yilgarnensis]
MGFRTSIASLAAALLFVTPFIAHAAIYKWVDGQGVTHYSQTPPSGQRYTQIDTPEGNGMQMPGPNPPTATGSPAPKVPHAAPTKPTKIPHLKQNCALANQNIKTLEMPRRVRVVKPDGSVEWLDDAQRAQRLEQAKSFVKRFCTQN